VVTDSSPPVADSDPAAVQFQPIRVRRGFEEIYDRIRAEIAAGRLRPGDRLPAEREMATQFGVSRQAVREALRGLQVSGLIQSRVGVGGGSFILKGDPALVIRGLEDLAVLGTLSYDSLLEARILITSDAVRLVCERATSEDFDRLDANTDELEILTQRGLLGERAHRRVDFYQILSEITHNEVFALLLDSLTSIVRMRIDTSNVPPMEGVIPLRREFVEALRQRRAEDAIRLLVGHFNRLEAHLRKAEQSAASD